MKAIESHYMKMGAIHLSLCCLDPVIGTYAVQTYVYVTIRQFMMQHKRFDSGTNVCLYNVDAFNRIQAA